MVGRAEAICTGTLAGYNAVRDIMEKPLLIIPRELAIGDIIGFENYRTTRKHDMISRYTFAGSVYFERMQKLGLYTTNIEDIKNRVEKLELTGVFSGAI